MSLLDSSAKSAAFPTIGTEVGGRVTRDSVEMQQRDFDDPSILLWWDKEETQPKMQLVVTVQTSLRDPENPDDDGERAIYVKGQMLSATRQACRKYKRGKITEGDYFSVTFVAEEPLPRGKKGNPKKVYEVEFRPGEPAQRQQPTATFSDGTPLPDEPPF